MREAPRSERDALTALRFFAALLVFIYHCAPTASFATHYALGHSGVGFFFLLSGFILTYTYHRTFAQMTAWPAVRSFYVARIARIYPVHVVATVFAVLVLWRFGGTTWNMSSVATREAAGVAQLLLVQSWSPDEKIYLGINAPAWSISTEMFFYAVFPFVVGFLLRSFAAGSARSVWAAAAMTWAFALTVALAGNNTAVWTAYVVPPLRLADFCVGMLLGIAFLRSQSGRSIEPAQNAPCASQSTRWEALAVAGVAVAIALSPHLPDALRYSVFLMPFWAVLIAVFVHEGGALSRVLSRPAFVALGRASFAFYLVHWSVIAIVGGTLGWSHPAAAMFIAFALSLVLSFALYHAVEQPLRTRVRGLFATPRTVRVPATLAASPES
jgi:peptidoglycan/LPS O-acetylase OafA/YrhL